MSERAAGTNSLEDADGNDLGEQDDIRAVLEVLRKLAEQTSRPVVRACLEQVRDDIVHLTTCDETRQSDLGQPATPI